MSPAKITALVSVCAFITKISAHGTVQGIVADGVWYRGYSPSFQYQHPPPIVAGWSSPQDIDNGFVSDYTSPDIICHKGATPGEAYVKVAAGNPVELQWTVWPESHHGPMLDYLASCGDDCTTVDKTKLLFNKIDEAGLVDGSTPPGHWASDDMIAHNNSWTVTIPSSIAPGKYVLRHETIALHSAENEGGAQNYPQCINLEISGSGSDSLPGGTEGTSLYTATDPGILINIYQKLTSYVIPGPKLYSGASEPAQSSTGTSAIGPTGASSRPPTTVTSVTVIPTKAPSTTPISSPASTKVANTNTSTDTEASETPCPSEPSPDHTSSSSSSSKIQPYTSASPAETQSSPPPPPPPSPFPSAPWTIPVPEPVEPSGSNVSPVSFTSTVTGRMGKPTKFTCYIDE